MRTGDFCTHNVVHIAQRASLQDAANLMYNRQVGALVVVDSLPGTLLPIGMVTDRDITIAIARGECDLMKTIVRDVMSSFLVVCCEDDDLFRVINMMMQNGVRRIPVVDDGGTLRGIVSCDDAIYAIAAHLSVLSSALGRE